MYVFHAIQVQRQSVRSTTGVAVPQTPGTSSFFLFAPPASAYYILVTSVHMLQPSHTHTHTHTHTQTHTLGIRVTTPHSFPITGSKSIDI